METIKKKRRRKRKISDECLGSIRAEFTRQRAERWSKMSIYIQIASVYGCDWQCVYNALKRAEDSKQTCLDVYQP